MKILINVSTSSIKVVQSKLITNIAIYCSYYWRPCRVIHKVILCYYSATLFITTLTGITACVISFCTLMIRLDRERTLAFHWTSLNCNDIIIHLDRYLHQGIICDIYYCFNKNISSIKKIIFYHTYVFTYRDNIVLKLGSDIRSFWARDTHNEHLLKKHFFIEVGPSFLMVVSMSRLGKRTIVKIG